VRSLALNEVNYNSLFDEPEAQPPWQDTADTPSNLFVKNTKKGLTKPAEDDNEASRDRDGRPGKHESYYICSRSVKRNPDLLIPGGALKGNMYFKQRVGEVDQPNQPSEGEVKSEKSETDDGGEAFNKLKNQVSRYFIDSNPTIKCRNCKEFGHFARECPNERKGMNCILCGKDTHDSFDCNEKLCFKCNKVGHKANECKETDVVKCLLCGQIGHLQARCLKVWNNGVF
jgi:hypothetical protein